MSLRIAVEQYLEHLQKIFGFEPEFTRVSKPGEFPPMHCFTFRDIPEKGYITGFTSGLSFVDYSAWEVARPELMISVKSEDPAWVHAAAEFAYQARGQFDFTIGQTVNYRNKIAGDSDMTAFLIFFQALLDKSVEKVKLPEWDVAFIQLFPIYEDEMLLIQEHGPQWLVETNPDLWDVKRESLAGRFRPH